MKKVSSEEKRNKQHNEIDEIVEAKAAATKSIKKRRTIAYSECSP